MMKAVAGITAAGVAAITCLLNYVALRFSSSPLAVLWGAGFSALFNGVLVCILVWNLLKTRRQVHETSAQLLPDRGYRGVQDAKLNFEMRTTVQTLVHGLTASPHNLDKTVMSALHELDHELKEHSQLIEFSNHPPLLESRGPSWAGAAVQRLFQR